jgi:hypothetical protein
MLIRPVAVSPALDVRGDGVVTANRGSDAAAVTHIKAELLGHRRSFSRGDVPPHAASAQFSPAAGGHAVGCAAAKREQAGSITHSLPKPP